MPIRTILVILMISGVLWGVLGLHTVKTAQAHSNCAATYTVQRGDWLAAIARRFNTTVFEMLRLNPQLQWRMNLLYPGEKLCVPGQAPPPTRQTSVLPNPHPVLSLEAEFTIPSGMSMTLQAPMTLVGIREALALQSRQGVLLITGTKEIPLATRIAETINGTPTPSLIAIRNGDGAASDFTLYEIGSTEVLSALRLDPNKPLALADDCSKRKLNEAYVLAATEPMSLTTWLESADGKRFPFRITEVGTTTLANYGRCVFVTDDFTQGFMAFAVIPSASEPNRHRVVLPAGPPGGDPCDGCIPQFICGWLGWYGEYICVMAQ